MVTQVLAPESLEEARQTLGEHPDIVPMAGCTDLLVTMSLNGYRPEKILDLSRLREIQGIEEVDGGARIGAATSFSAISEHKLVRMRLPALARAAGTIGGWQIRNRATLGGNLATASPAGDSLPVLLALNATIVLVGPEETRRVPCDEFFLAYRKVDIRKGEIIAWIHIAHPKKDSVQAFRKVGTRQAQAISKVAVAMNGWAQNGTVQELRLAAGSVAPTPVRLPQAEAAGLGRPVGRDTADLVARAAVAEVEPIDDVRSDARYRSFALEGVVRGFLLQLD